VHPAPESSADGWTESEAALFETFVVPGYLARFVSALSRALVPSAEARVGHPGCRTGAGDAEVLRQLADGQLIGWDPSVASVELARTKARAGAFQAEYSNAHSRDFAEGAFSHVLVLHPRLRSPVASRTRTPSSASGSGDWGAVATREWGVAIEEGLRLLAPMGQLLVALPLAGSFAELVDLLDEYALKYDDHDLGLRVREFNRVLPTRDELAAFLGAVTDYAEVTEDVHELPFEAPRALVDDPAVRLLVLPELSAAASAPDAQRYLLDALSRYFSESPLTLTVRVGVASARKRPA
jgi:hypothetical protein